MNQHRAGQARTQPGETFMQRILEPPRHKPDTAIIDVRRVSAGGKCTTLVHQPIIRQSNEAVEPDKQAIWVGKLAHHLSQTVALRHAELDVCHRFGVTDHAGGVVVQRIMIRGNEAGLPRTVKPLQGELSSRVTAVFEVQPAHTMTIRYQGGNFKRSAGARCFP